MTFHMKFYAPNATQTHTVVGLAVKGVTSQHSVNVCFSLLFKLYNILKSNFVDLFTGLIVPPTVFLLSGDRLKARFNTAFTLCNKMLTTFVTNDCSQFLQIILQFQYIN